MKFTNSSVHNKQHFTAVACIVVVLSVGVIFVSISNEPCKQGSSAEETLRRRLQERNFFTDREGKPLKYSDFQSKESVKIVTKDSQAAVKTEQSVLAPAQAKPIAGDEQAVITGVSEATGKSENKPAPFLYTKLGAWCGVFAGVSIPAVWGFFMWGNQYNTEVNYLSHEEGCLAGFVTTFALMYIWLFFLSTYGGTISRQFKVNGNGFIVVSTACILFTGASLSCAIVSPHTMWVFGALSIGSVVACIFFRFFRPVTGSAIESYVVTGVVSVLTTMSAGFLIFGAHFSADYLLFDSLCIFGVAAGVVLLWAVGVRFAIKAILKCGEERAQMLN